MKKLRLLEIKFTIQSHMASELPQLQAWCFLHHIHQLSVLFVIHPLDGMQAVLDRGRGTTGGGSLHIWTFLIARRSSLILHHHLYQRWKMSS